ncbi:DNA polymerase [Candidatus Saccharibacteria bacterium]|nr:DNA polymerase [Candidatus Saccharibacteria bacterium]
MTKKFALIDGKSIFYRSYYAMPSLSLRDGTPTGGVYGFAAMALELLRKIEPDYVAVAWDKSKTNIRRRVKIYPEYKANRHPAPPDFYAQIPLLKNLLDAFGWPLLELDDYEADDIMGTLSEQANKQGIHTIMISSDLDMLQVVDSDTELYALKKGLANLEKFDVAAFEKKYGLKVEQFLDLKSLKGDNSDNIPGVPGIGEKTAITLLQEYGSLEAIYDNLDKIKPAWRAKLESGKDSAYMSRELARIWCDAPLKLDLAAVDVQKLDVAKLRTELEKLEFTSLLRRLPEYMRDDTVTSEPEFEDVPGLFFTESDGRIIVNDGKVLAEKLLAEDKPLPEIKFDTRIAGFLLGRVEKVANLDQLKIVATNQAKTLNAMPKLAELARELDFPMQNLLAKIEARGVKIDTEILASQSREFAKKIAKLEQTIWETVGYEFNISSAPQLSDALFRELKLPTTGIKKSVRGYFSTGKAELDKLRGQHPIIDRITEIREILKLKNTYVDALPNLVATDGKLHTDFRQDVTATGRLSSSNPNLQNIPIRTELGREIRRAFVASDGKVLVSADYSQFELRLAAALSGDTNLIEDFEDDRVDIHTKTAAEAYGVAFDDVTPEMRRHAKIINFGVLYGMSPHGLAAATGMDFKKAQEFIARYFRVRQPIRDFIDATIDKAKTEGYVETLFGRRRLTPDVKSANFVIREAAKRAAANMPIQGTEADLMKMAMLKVETAFSHSSSSTDALLTRRMSNAPRSATPVSSNNDEKSSLDEFCGVRAEQILQIHDSILVECAPADARAVGEKLKHIMENIHPNLGVRLKVDIKSGKNWAEL